VRWSLNRDEQLAVCAEQESALAGGDRETEDNVCYALNNCAPASVAPLLELLNHSFELARQRACHALRLVGQGVGDRLIPAADALLARLQDTSDAVRGEAALTLVTDFSIPEHPRPPARMAPSTRAAARLADRW
jgi:hypothetical protein